MIFYAFSSQITASLIHPLGLHEDLNFLGGM